MTKSKTQRSAVRASPISQDPDQDLRELPEYQILEEYFFQSRPQVLPKRSALSQRGLAYYDQFYWNPQDLRYVSDRSVNGRASADPFSIFHSSMHHLLVSAFRPEFSERPQFTLACEALVSLLEFYFPIRLVEVRGPKALAAGPAQHILELLELGTARLGHAYGDRKKLAFIKHATQNPFLAYQKAFAEMMKIYARLFAVACRRKRGQSTDLGALHEELRQSPYSQVIFGFQIMNNIVFVLAYCGEKSSAADRRDVRALVTLVESNDGMASLLSELLGMAKRNLKKR